MHSQAMAELRAGRKRSHWMWFVFPQLAGLGRSKVSRHYGLTGIEEAEAYLEHPVLGVRLNEAFRTILAATGSAEQILGGVDAMKLRSSATLFLRAAPGTRLFGDVLTQFFDGGPDPATDALLRRPADAGG
jgi:uncharacterized protein (DUF1810 family)